MIFNQSCRGSAVFCWWVLEAFRTLFRLNAVQQGEQLQMVWLETVHARSRGSWQAGMLAWDGKVTAPAPAIYSGLFGLCPVKPHCSFPQLRPRLNCRGWDQSPEGHWLKMRGQPPAHHIYQEDVFFPPHLHRREKVQLCSFQSCLLSEF